MERTLTQEFELELAGFLEAINRKYDYDFREYSPKSLKRMLVQAMTRLGCATLGALQSSVLGDSKRFDELIQILTIPVSEMFRDPAYYLALRKMVIPHLRTYPSIKVWVAGCSTGEEVYSLAILLQEEELLERTTLYATDINSTSLEKAARGVYPLEEIQRAALSHQASGGKQALSAYYAAAGDAVTLDGALRKNVTFTDHSLATDAAFSEMHLISCRNVLIYFKRELQDRALGVFHESLCRKCFLGMGAKETVQFSKYAREFAPFVKEARIFQKQ